MTRGRCMGIARRRRGRRRRRRRRRMSKVKIYDTRRKGRGGLGVLNLMSGAAAVVEPGRQG